MNNSENTKVGLLQNVENVILSHYTFSPKYT
jgi:hypothetical protein